ncbi:MAG TPA: carbohydrate ABC transporter permease, partial [Paraburkholderia sp.]
MSQVAATPTVTPAASVTTAPAASPLAVVRRSIPGILAWLISLALFFPIFWMTITAFKTEQQAYSSSVFFTPTLESFREVFARSNY